MRSVGNHYRKAFENWLKENKVRYVSVDQQKRAAFSKSKIKSFDFVFYAPDSAGYIVEIKGRKFTSKTFAAFGSLQSWVSAEDIDVMEKWLGVYNGSCRGLFIFAYELEKFDVDTDGREIFEFENKRYVFVAVGFDDYKKRAKLRSRKWKTLYLDASSYKDCALNLNEIIGQRVRL